MRLHYFVILLGFLSQAIQGAVTMSARLAEGVAPLGLGEPVVAEVTYTNESAQAVRLRFPASVTYMVKSSPSGSQPRPSLLANGLETPDQGAGADLAPGASYRHLLLINQFVEFDKVGQYQITVSMRESDSEASFSIDIGERNEARLLNSCARWGEALSDTDSLNSYVASQVMSSFRDAAAIPCLIRFTSNHLSLTSIDALLNMESVPAVEALYKLANSPDDAVARRATDRLELLRRETKKDDVRRAAEKSSSLPRRAVQPPLILR